MPPTGRARSLNTAQTAILIPKLARIDEGVDVQDGRHRSPRHTAVEKLVRQAGGLPV